MKKIFTLIAAAALGCTISANAEKVTLYPYVFEGDNYVSCADSQVTEISRDEDGNFIISDFLYSETPISFKFDIPAPGKYSDITFTGYLDRETATYPYLMDAEGYYPSCYLYDYNNVEGWTEIKWPYVCEEGYSYAYRYDLNDPENAGYKEYYGMFCMSGSNLPWLYIEFYFDMPEANAVNSMDSAADAPAVYYNLSGQRVDNPANGVFVRLQGGKATKVVK